MKAVLKRWTPAPVWRLAHDARAGLRSLRLRMRKPDVRSYQGVSTIHCMDALHTGIFAAAYEPHWRLDPYNLPSGGDRTRMRVYNICHFARMALRAPGDFICAGISWGIAARVLFDFLDWPETGRTLHLIDPFLGVDNSVERNPVEKYNADENFVRAQYPPGAAIAIHRAFIPDCFPLPNTGALAFAHLNTTDFRAEARSLDYLIHTLSPGGIIVIDGYAIGEGNAEIFRAALTAEPFVLPTGQAVIAKP